MGSLFLRSIVRRAVMLWLGVRLLIGVVGLLPTGALFLPTGLRVSVVMAAIVVILSVVELNRRGELLLLANLGTSAERLVLISALSAGVLEATLSLMLSGAA